MLFKHVVIKTSLLKHVSHPGYKNNLNFQHCLKKYAIISFYIFYFPYCLIIIIKQDKMNKRMWPAYMPTKNNLSTLLNGYELKYDEK